MADSGSGDRPQPLEPRAKDRLKLESFNTYAEAPLIKCFKHVGLVRVH